MDFMQKVIVRKPDDCTRFKELRMRHNDYISFCEMKRFSRGGGIRTTAQKMARVHWII